MNHDRTHNLTIDKPYRLSNDNIFNKVLNVDYNPNPPPMPGYFLEFQGGGVPFLLLNGQFMTLL